MITKSLFLSELEVEELKEEGTWQLISDLKYQSEIYNGIITVPCGFITDFASVPRIPLIYSLFGDRAHRESVIHDFLYQTHLVSKEKADAIFLEAMQERSKSWWIRYPMWLGVKLGGSSAYKSGLERFTVLGNSENFCK